MSTTVTVSRDIAAPATAVYDLVADLPAMGRWSPENTGGTWMNGATAAAPGFKFKGTNANESKRWSTISTIETAERGKDISWRVDAVGLKIARWSYRFTDTPTGCHVEETWTDLRNGFARLMGGLASKVKDRAAHNRAGMEKTLAALAAAAESA